MATSPLPTSPTPIRSQPGALVGAAKSSHAYKNAAQYEALKRKAIQTRLTPAHSALVRQKGVAGQNLKSLAGELKAAKGGAKGVLSQELTHVKKAALPAHKLALKDAAGLKKAIGVKKVAALKAMAPAHSALVRQKGVAGQNLKSLAGELKAVKGGAKGVLNQELTHVKKAALPAQNLAVKDAAALKKAMGLKKKAALKATAPSRSALVRQKNLLGQDLATGKSTIGKDMSGIKQVAKQSNATQSAKKLAATAKKAGAAANQGEQRGFGRLLRKIQSS